MPAAAPSLVPGYTSQVGSATVISFEVTRDDWLAILRERIQRDDSFERVARIERRADLRVWMLGIPIITALLAFAVGKSIPGGIWFNPYAEGAVAGLVLTVLAVLPSTSLWLRIRRARRRELAVLKYQVRDVTTGPARVSVDADGIEIKYLLARYRFPWHGIESITALESGVLVISEEGPSFVIPARALGQQSRDYVEELISCWHASRSAAAALMADVLRDADWPCPDCGYNLRALASFTCPECGRDLALFMARRAAAAAPRR
jgi:predicted RNA-binding Zn-ribbon protein involved in translation (DUF1610 family)